MKNLHQVLLSLCLIIATFFLFQNEAKATHVAGGYVQLGCTNTPGVYEVTMILYRDCARTATIAAKYDINFTNTCGLARVTAKMERTSMREVSQICDAQLHTTRCNNGTNPGYEEYTFKGTVALGDCDSWTANYSLCCRNTASNVNNANNTNFNIISKFNTAVTPCNTTPTVTAQPEPFVCINQPVTYNLGAYEPDGDSISYSLVPALHNGNPVNYRNSYDANTPIHGAVIDPVSGTVSFTPDAVGNYIVVVRMTEWNDDGVIVSVTDYEYQTYVLNCSNQSPQPPPTTGPNAGVTNVTGSIVRNGPNSLTMCQGFQGCFEVVFTDSDQGDELSVVSNLENVLPGATITQSGTNPLTVSVCWTPVTTSGTVTLNFLVEDDACPITGQNNYAATINVVNPGVPSVTTTRETCGGANEGTATITMSGGVPPFTYNIAGQQTGSNSTGNFTDLAPGNYTYAVNTGGGCDVTGTFTIVAGPTLSIAGSSTEVLCNASSDGTATATPTGGPAPYVYVWSQGGTPIGQTSQTASNLSVGSYEVSVTDRNGCVGNETVVVTEPDVLAGVVTPINTLCRGTATGQVDVSNVTGGTEPYTYRINGGTYQNGTNFGGLAVGSYTVEIKDANECTLELPVTVGEPTSLSIAVDNISDATCGGSSGTIVVAATGGTPTYEYAIGGTTSSTGTFTNIAAGTHEVIVTDANGCTKPVNAIVEAVAVPTATLDTQVDLNCFGGSNGNVLIGAPGALAPVSYSLDGGPGQPSNAFNGLTAGDYTVEITDGNGCTAEVDFTITQPTLLTYTSTPVAASCAGVCDGKIAIVATGGTSPYQYSSNAGASFRVDDSLRRLCAGTTQVVVRDANGCLSNSNVTVPEPAALTATFVNTDPVCRDGSDGEIEITASGGTPSFEYSLAGGTFQPGNTLTGLTSGNKEIVVRDGNGCEFTSTQMLNNPPGIDIDTLSMTKSNCGYPDGKLVLEASGENPPFLYSLDGSPNQPSGTFTRRSGAYKIIVTDALGCTDSTFFGIDDVEMQGILLDKTDLNCFESDDGSVEVENVGGFGVIQYEIDNITPAQSGNGYFDGLAAGVHIVAIYDAGFCLATVRFELEQPDEIDFTGVVTDVSCNGGNSGEIDIQNVTGGTGAYEYTMDMGSTILPIGVVPNLSAGTHTVMVIDERFCSYEKTFTIGEASLIEYSTNVFDLNCNGDNTGMLQVVASGGTGAFQYSNDNGVTFGASEVFMGLSAGDYDLVVEDALGCQIDNTVTVTEPAPLTATYDIVNTDCFGGSDGEITITAAGGTTPYQYSLNAGVTLTSNNNITAISAGTYEVFIKDSHGCTITSDPQIVDEPTQVTFTSVEDPSTCSTANGEIEITANGGTPGYVYSIDNGANFVSGNVFTGLSEGSFDLMVKDDNDCPARGIQEVTDLPSPRITMLTKTNPLCFGDANGQIVVTAVGGTGALSYSLNGGAPQASSTLTGIPDGTHTVTIYDINGCVDSDATVVLTQPDLLEFDSSPTNLLCFENSTGKILVTPRGGTPAYQYSFDNGATFGSSPTNNFIAAGTYDIVLKDAKGCEAVGTEVVTEPTELTIDSSTGTDASCKSSCDGEIQLTVNGGTGAYAYNWVQLDATVNTDLATGLCAGTYDFIVEDDNG